MNHELLSQPVGESGLPPSSRAAQWILIILMVIYCVFFGWLAVIRHQTFGSSAMDMGYTDQVVWNTLHGRMFRFSTLENAQIDLPLEQFRRTDILLAYHVELLLAPLSLLYLIWSDLRMLLLAQVLIIALGAWPVYLLARDHLRNAWAGLAFALAYLLAPATQGATLADFHTSSLMMGLFVFAMYAARHRCWRVYLITISICLLAKEDISLSVLMLGGWLFLVRREWRVGLVTMALGLGWFFMCSLVILPHYNGLTGSPFMHRLAIFGPTLRESLANFIAEPALLLRWLIQPEIVTYLRGLLASGGYLSFLSPLTLAIAAPLVAINIFSAWNWTYSGGEHYSAMILPIVIVSAIYGMGRLAKWVARWPRLRHDQVVLGLSLMMLAISGSQYIRQGIWPFSSRFSAPRMTEHDRVGHSVISQIPPEASVSAQSNLYPHVSQRERAYFYPAINGAEYILLDAAGVTYPLSVDGLFFDAQQLMRSGEYGVVEARDGYLLLQRGAAPSLDLKLPVSFYTFAQGKAGKIPHAMRVRFGDVLELVGWDYAYLNVVQSHSLPVTITTWWRSLTDLEYDYQFAFFFTREDGAIVFAYDQDTATTLWHPPYRWRAGDLVRMETPVLTAGGLEDVLVAVANPGKDVWQTDARLLVSTDGMPSEQIVDEGTLYRMMYLP